MCPFEDLYGIKCITLKTWGNPMNIIILGPKLLKEMEQEAITTRQNLKATQYRQKIYSHKNKMLREFWCQGQCLPQSEAKEEFLESWKLCQDVRKILWAI